MKSSNSHSAVMPIFLRSDIQLERGDGMYVWDANGKKYLDFFAGIGVCSVGHSHPHLVAALKTQCELIWHISNFYSDQKMERLANRLTADSFAESVFFCNSGSEAVEAMIKVARRYHAVRGNPERWRIITLEGGFHGRTLATIAAGNKKAYLDGFGPPVEGFDSVACGITWIH